MYVVILLEQKLGPKSRSLAKDDQRKTHFALSFPYPNFYRPFFNILSSPKSLITMSEANGSAASDQIEVDAAPAPTSGSPADFLKSVVGHMVSVRLNSGVDYRGTF